MTFNQSFSFKAVKESVSGVQLEEKLDEIFRQEVIRISASGGYKCRIDSMMNYLFQSFRRQGSHIWCFILMYFSVSLNRGEYPDHSVFRTWVSHTHTHTHTHTHSIVIISCYTDPYCSPLVPILLKPSDEICFCFSFHVSVLAFTQWV